MNRLEIVKLLGAIQRYILRKQKIPDPKALQALEILSEYFAMRYDITVTADMVLGVAGVNFEPMDMSITETVKLLRQRKKRLFNGG